MTTKKRRSTDGFSTLDETLDPMGTRQAYEATAIKEALACPVEQALRADIAAGLAEVEAGRVKDFDVDAIIVRATALSAEQGNVLEERQGGRVRRVGLTAELPEEWVDAVKRSKMDRRRHGPNSKS